jgi:hypothetical protein
MQIYLENNNKVLYHLKNITKTIILFLIFLILLFLFRDVTDLFNILKDCELILKKNITNFSSFEKIHCSLLKAIEINIKDKDNVFL